MGTAAKTAAHGEAVHAEVERWMTKKEAADALELSTRAIERLAQSREIKMRHEKPGPGRRYSMVYYSAPDIEAIREERRNGVRVVSNGSSTAMARLQSAPPPEAQLAVAHAQVNMFEGLALHLAKLSQLYPAPNKKAWLTFDEAVEHSGLTPSMLEEVLRAGTIYSIGRGLKTWRIQRASLDGWSSEPKQ